METSTNTSNAVVSARRNGEIWLAHSGESIETYVLEGGWSVSRLENLTAAFDLHSHPEISALLTALRREKHGTRLLSGRERARILEACDRDANAVRGLRDRALLSLRMPAVSIIALTRETAPGNVEMVDWLAFWSGPVVFPVFHYGAIRPDQSINADTVKTILRLRACQAGISDASTLSVAALRTPASRG